MSDDFKQVQQHAQELRNQHSTRNSTYDQIEEMFLLKWADESKVKKVMDKVKVTKSPSARNEVLGGIRLLIANDPIISVPFDKNSPDAHKQSEGLEQFASVMLQASGRVRGCPVHHDLVYSMMLFAEGHLAITSTQDMVRHAAGGTKGAQVRAESIAKMTPFVFDVWDPRTGYPEFDNYGLISFYREVETTRGAVLDEFGSAASRVLKADGGRYDKVTLCHFWDYENRFTWVDGDDAPIVQEAHGLPFIPVAVQLGEGSRLFAKPEDQRQPFLYTLLKSGLWERQNLALTVLYTMVFAMGANPMYVYKRADADKHLDVDHSKPGGVAEIGADEDFGPLMKAVIDPSLLKGLEIADQKGEESTIYAQTLGEPIGGNAPYSMVALLHQAGRLPLLVTQLKAGWALGDALKIALRWMKEDGKQLSAKYADKSLELKPADIPEQFEIQCKLDIALPQDRLQMANIGSILVRDDLTSKNWIRENILNIGQSDQMTQEIWGEKAAEMRAQQYFAQQMQMMALQNNAQQQLQAMTAPQIGAQPQPGMPQPGMPQPGIQHPPPTEPQPQGLPPEMMQGSGAPLEEPGMQAPQIGAQPGPEGGQMYGA